MEYSLELEDSGAAYEAFDRYAREHAPLTARALALLEEFAKDYPKYGEFLRGSSDLSIFVVPPRSRLDDGTEAGFIVLVNENARAVDVLCFLVPAPQHPWRDYEAWAETYLGI